MRTSNSSSLTAFLASEKTLTCSLDGTELSTLDGRIFVEEITEEPNWTPETAKKPTQGTLLLNAPGRESLNIRIDVYVKERDLAERTKVIRKIMAWARNGGLMTCGHRRGQQIRVECVMMPKPAIRDTKKRLQLAFASYEGYWRDTDPATDEGTGTSLSLTLTPNGDAECPLEAEVTASEAVTSVQLAVGSDVLAFTGLSMESGDTLEIVYDDNGFLTAKVGTDSYLGYRSAESADDLWLEPGEENTVTVTTDGACSVTVIGRGVYL